MRCLYIIAALSVLTTGVTFAQRRDKTGSYDFRAALSEYRDSLAAGRDSAFFTEACKRAGNGIALSEFCHKPQVLDRRRFHISEFFLFYPFPDRSWHATQYKGVYVNVPGEVPDTLVRPVSDSLEFFSVMSGKEKYFSSTGLYGVGGQDLYLSRWNEGKKCWGEPENLGFPYSSPYDDFLFVNTDDGRFSLFASNRDCPEDSVNVYVVRYESVPVKSRVDRPEELESLCALVPQENAGPTRKEESATARDKNTSIYIGKIALIRRIRDSLSLNAKRLDSLRTAYREAPESGKLTIAGAISSEELDGMGLKARMKTESDSLRAMEMDFLMKGVTIDIDKLISESDKEEEVSETGYRFTRREPGRPVIIRYIKQTD